MLNFLRRAYFNTVSVLQYSTRVLDVIVNETLVSHPFSLPETGHQSDRIVSSGASNFRRWTPVQPCRTTSSLSTLGYSVIPPRPLRSRPIARVRSFRRISTGLGPLPSMTQLSPLHYGRARTRCVPQPSRMAKTSETPRYTGIMRCLGPRSRPCMGQICSG